MGSDNVIGKKEEIDDSSIDSLEQIDELSERLGEPGWLRNIRKGSWENFLGLPPPRFRYGISLNMDLSDIKFPYDDILSQADGIKVDADSRIKIMTFSEVFENQDTRDILKEKFMSIYAKDSSRLTAFHGAFLSDGLMVIIPKGIVVEKPIRISMKMKSRYLGTHIIIIADEMSKASFEEINIGSPEEGLRTHAVEIFAGEGSKITYESVQSLGDDVFDSRIYRASVSTDAEVNLFTALLGGKASKTEASTSLSGRGATSRNFGLFLGREDARYDIYNSSIHSAPDTYSDMNNRGVAKDSSKAIYRGLIRIDERAKNSNGYQTHDSLMLGDSAESHAVPNLEIKNNDVKCSHGATIGQVDEESMFYLMSRGLGQKQAEDMIVSGFLEAMTKNASSPKIQTFIREKLDERGDDAVLRNGGK